MKRVICVLLVMVSLSFSGCGMGRPAKAERAESPQALLEQFVGACNRLDIEKALACMDPDRAEELQMVFSTISGIGSNRELIRYAAGLYLKGRSVDVVEILETLRVQPEEQEGSVLRVAYSYQSEGETVEGKARVECRYQDEQWYLVGFSPVES